MGDDMMKNIVVVTGASSGIGKEFATQISESVKEVDEIWAIARDEKNLDELKEIIKIPVVALPLDLTKESDINLYREKLNRERPNVRILVNSAGFGKFGHDETIPTDVKLNMVDLNIKAILSLVDYTLPYMFENSNIINIASAYTLYKRVCCYKGFCFIVF